VELFHIYIGIGSNKPTLLYGEVQLGEPSNSASQHVWTITICSSKINIYPKLGADVAINSSFYTKSGNPT
jgi:hypothetical protein